MRLAIGCGGGAAADDGRRREPRNCGRARRTTPAIPTIKSVLGHDFGDEVSSPEEIAIYLRALAAAAPDRTRLVEYARTWEGRPLHVLAIASPARIGPARPDQGRPQASGRPAHAVGRRSVAPARRPARGDLADARRPRQRDLVVGCRTGRGLPPAGRSRRRDGRHDPSRVDRAHRPAREPGRPLALPLPEQAGTRGHPGWRAPERGTRRAVAGRAFEPLSVRHEPRLVRADAARDAWPADGRARLLPARRRGPARDGRRLVVLLRAAGRSAQPVHHARPDPLARDLRPRQRRALRRSRLRVLHPRGIRLLLSRVRRVVAHLQRRHRHDVRAGVGTRPGLHPRRRHHSHLSPGRRASLQRRHHDGLHRRRQSGAPVARLPRVPPIGHRRGREDSGARVRAAAGQRPRNGRAAGAESGRAGHRRADGE